MFMKTLSQGILVAALGLAAPFALAQSDYVVWNGGVGEDDRAEAPAKGTKLVFFSENGQYIAGVHFTLKDSEGKVLVDDVSKGPWVILNLPNGTYSLVADFEGFREGSEIVVDEDYEEYAYMFNNS